jgi:hypothetical protein
MGIQKYKKAALNTKFKIVFFLIVCTILAAGCTLPQTTIAIPTETSALQATATSTPFQPIPPTQIIVLPTATSTPAPLSFWVDESVPEGLKKAIALPQGVILAANPSGATFRLEVERKGENAPVQWAYALVAPFPTYVDGVSLKDLKKAWLGGQASLFGGHPILMSASSKAAFSSVWGEPGGNAVQVVTDANLLSTAWDEKIAWAMVPFERLEPRWKVLRVDSVSPLDSNFDLSTYPLVVPFTLTGDRATLDLVMQAAQNQNLTMLPTTNRDPKKMTTVIMTGVTALVRATADRMERKGNTYPARDIVDWLRDADITHISNEVSFNPSCKPPNASDPSLIFCSNPKYIELLDYIQADVIELTGNHMNDYGRDALLYSLDLYRQHGMKYYASGKNLEEARQPIKLEHNGNKIAFMGCNPVGPSGVWATSSEAGAANCDYDYMTQQIRQLRSEGYLPIVTFQYYESYDVHPSPKQIEDFRRVSEAGAVIVDGSQAHRPQAMEFDEGGFIHYGLGNLFFDQMETPWTGTRDEFIDRHVFYEGRYISTELKTAMLEDYARPRPTTQTERNAILGESFDASGWNWGQ